MKKLIIMLLLTVLMILCASCEKKSDVDTLTYAVFPYLPDTKYYQELIEKRWSELEPDIKLVRAEWDCYSDSAPAGIDVVMYDCFVQDKIIDSGWVKPIERSSVQNINDIFPFASEGASRDGRLYGIPVFLCGNFLIYDTNCDILKKAEHLTDLSHCSELLVIASEDPMVRSQYILEAETDIHEKFGPPADNCAEEEKILALIDVLAVNGHKQDTSDELAVTYDNGVGEGYIGFSESMRFLKERMPATDIKAVSFSSGRNLPLLYADVVAVTAGVNGERYNKCVELMNVMADAEILTFLSDDNGEPAYLLLARQSPYTVLSEKFPLYNQLEKIASDENNQIITG